MVKIKGRKYRQVSCKKNGAAPKGARKFRRGKSRQERCFLPVGK